MTSQVLERTVFEISRELEFFTEKELEMQIGYSKYLWPIVLVKELIDNCLDACEHAGINPQIAITVEDHAVSIEDNGPGLPIHILQKSLNYRVRVSDKAFYVSPTRGQLGNALKCVWAASLLVAEGDKGCVEVSTNGVTHHIQVSLDRIAQSPRLEYSTEVDGFVTTGTLVKIYWPRIASYLQGESISSFYMRNSQSDIQSLVTKYSAFNPHACFRLCLPHFEVDFAATVPDWQKWLTSDPTHPHWYDLDQFRSLIAAYLLDERSGNKPRTVREFIAEFHGLSGTAKQKAVTDAAGLTGKYLHDFVEDDNAISDTAVLNLLQGMSEHSRGIKPEKLGVIGSQHLTHVFRSCHVEANSIRYKKISGITESRLPYVIEVAFGISDGDEKRKIWVGLNFSPVLKIPIQELFFLLERGCVDYFDPVLITVHLVCPRLEYTERGKGAIVLPEEILGSLKKAVDSVTKEWQQAKRHADRQERLRDSQLERLRRANKTEQLSIKDAAYQVMAEAYIKASGNGRYPANARQVMYAARPLVLSLTRGECWKNSSYFTQHLLPDFINEHPQLTADWDIVFDSRGRFVEPYTRSRVDLGTLPVREYIRSWSKSEQADTLDYLELDHRFPTVGARHRYNCVLFIEKEGFYPLLETAQIAERWGIAIMSTKGMSVTAARALVEALSLQGVTILVAHDFDKSGFSIVNTLKSSTRRYTFQERPHVLNLGLSLADVEEMQLASEPVDYEGKVNPQTNLQKSGASESECNFLVRGKDSQGKWTGQRVELNAMSSDLFIEWLESRLERAGIKKLIPDTDTLAAAYQLAYTKAILQTALDQTVNSLDGIEISIPNNLMSFIEDGIEGNQSPWDDAIWNLAIEHVKTEIIFDSGIASYQPEVRDSLYHNNTLDGGARFGRSEGES